MSLKARFRRMSRPPRRAIPTRAGMFVLLSPIVLGLAAMSATNNLLFVMVGAALGAIVLSGVLSEINVRGVSARIEPLSAVYAGESARIRVVVERADPRALPSYELRVCERRGGIWRAIFKDDRDVLDVTVPVLDDRRAESIGERTFDVRGPAQLFRTELVSTYPFGLLYKSCDLDVDAAVIVRPKRVPVPKALEDPRAIAADGELSTRRGVGVEVYGLREHRDGDSVHRIHALRSLSLGSDVIVETTGMERPTAWLGLANDAGADPIALERAIELAAAALVAWDRLGYTVGLSTASAHFPPGDASLDRLLDTLALLQPEAGEEQAKSAASVRAGPAVWLTPHGAVSRGRPLVVSCEGSVG